MNNQRILSKITGFSILIMALLAVFTFGYASPKLFDYNQPDIAQNLTENLNLYKFMLLGILVIILLDFLLSHTLYLYFKNLNNKLALLSFYFRVSYTLLFCLSAYFLLKNIAETNNVIIIQNYNSFEFVWSIGLIFFGIHLFMIGILMWTHKSIPKLLGYLTIIGGISYVLVHILKTTFTDLTELTSLLNTILALPMALGELGLAIWLIVKGGRLENSRNYNSNNLRECL